jgi:hypothetical protein
VEAAELPTDHRKRPRSHVWVFFFRSTKKNQ